MTEPSPIERQTLEAEADMRVGIVAIMNADIERCEAERLGRNRHSRKVDHA